MTRIRVAVLFGGRSAEHEISVISARSIMAAIDPEQYEVVPVGITRAGRWLTGGDPMKALSGDESGTPDGEWLGESITSLEPANHVPSGVALSAPHARLPAVDVVFPVLHGPLGEDGSIQGMLELADLPYVGAGVLASAVGMDKAFMKQAFRAARIPILPYQVVLEDEWARDPDVVLCRIERAIPYPLFGKPANLGSSIGANHAPDRAGLIAAIDDALRYDRKAIIERAVDARELECAVLGNEAPEASRAGEIIPKRGFYDYAAKYTDPDTELIVPANVPARVEQRIRQLAIKAFKSIDCAGMARVDFFLERATGKVLVNEINTIPGCTPVSMFPRMWAAAGVSYPQLVERLIQLALDRHRKQARYRGGRTGEG